MNCLEKKFKVIESKNLEIKDSILTKDGVKKIFSISSTSSKRCYDIHIIDSKDLFMNEPNFILSNGVVSHNSNLSIVNDAKELVEKRRGIKIDWDSIDLNDPKVYENVVKAHDHFGVFQYECLSKDTVIEDKTIEQWYKTGSPKNLSSFDESTEKIIQNDCLKIVKSGKKQLYELELEDGKKIKGSADHQFLTKNGWKKLKDLSEDDQILTV